MQIQYSLNGQHEIVQPGRVSLHSHAGGKKEIPHVFNKRGRLVFQVFLKEGTLMKLSRKVMQPRMFFLVSDNSTRFHGLLLICLTKALFPEVLLCLCFAQFNDALMYTTPVQSSQYKLISVLSLAGMKVRDTLWRRSSFSFSLIYYPWVFPLFSWWKSAISVSQVSKPSQEAYQNELNIESVERSFILSAGSVSARDKLRRVDRCDRCG